MQIAFIHATEPGSVDATLNAVLAQLSGAGWRLEGVIQEPSGTGDRHRCDMDLIDVARGDRLSISQNLGRGSTGCRLDPNAIEIAARRVQDDLRVKQTDLLVINRFGKIEAMGLGFCPVIAEALEIGVPVLLGVNDLNRPAFESVSGGLVV
ncbi:DUF2478 domain-containing protein [Rhodobacter calidifons]|uniref:DUF2478 domain-containing protein n=1 Tax=Rhodobacter calidifons TaxID=2715277 RepID=A0ABX0GAB0_9RHOB|nr:DUF2478 domain-containing protein [Rhodobacter calidifons]NHB77626.1 DUF2478 domain-containing protein [Rhodobacter calidifons]